MKFWDASALVALMVDEAMSRQVREISGEDRFLMISCITPIEITSALYRRVRTNELDREELKAANTIFARLRDEWLTVHEFGSVVPVAIELLARRALRAGDAIQLATAIVASRDKRWLPFVTLDKHLAHAAAAEGFYVLPQSSA